jgi:hypothetical protein
MSMTYCLRLAKDSEISKLLDDPEKIEDWLFNDEDEPDAELEKAWHGIHFILTGSDWNGDEPLCYLLAGGSTVGEIDVGYGPARALTSTQVEEFRAAISNLSKEDFKNKFDREAFEQHEIYPRGWQLGKDEENIDFLYSHFVTLREFLEAAKAKGYGAIVWLQ